ncbi:DnaB-like helicase C-terminal domain-containing protein, partial [Neisseria sicca]|uniref:DnaB-like helicase C-terminal domain-containing protein n=1 Tax=Neisseria sicca TaxID=490 RepID=UPI0034D95485
MPPPAPRLARQFNRKFPLILIHYLQLIPPSRPSHNPPPQLPQISPSLKPFPKQLQLPLIPFSHFSPTLQHPTHNPPIISHFRQSPPIHHHPHLI